MNHLTFGAAKRLFAAAAAVAMLSVPSLAAEAEPQLAVSAGVTTGSSLRLRSEPSTAGSVLTYLDKDVTVAVLSSAPADGWYHIAYNGREGFVSADYLTVEG